MSQTPPQIRFCVSRDGTRIAYAISGSGPPLLWLPHWVHTLKFDVDNPIWSPWLLTLARRHSVIRYDWRGCGLSDRDGIDLSFERHVEDLEAVVTAVGLTRFVLFAMAFATYIGLQYAARHPQQVSRLILYAAASRGRLARMATPADKAEVHTRMTAIDLGWPDPNSGYGQFYTSLQVTAASAEQKRLFNEQLHAATSRENAIGLMKAFYVIDLRDVAPQVRCPTLVLHARHDSNVPFDEGRAVAALVPGARFVPLESRNHLVLDTEPAWPHLVAELDAFLPDSREDSPTASELNLAELTARERQILEILAEGVDNKEIGKRLGISEKTVRNQVSIILDKLGLASRLQAVVRARESLLGRR